MFQAEQSCPRLQMGAGTEGGAPQWLLRADRDRAGVRGKASLEELRALHREDPVVQTAGMTCAVISLVIGWNMVINSYVPFDWLEYDE